MTSAKQIFEGETLEEVKKKADSIQLVPGLFIRSKKVISDGKKLQSQIGIADTTEEAFKKVDLPWNSTIVKRQVINNPQKRTIRVIAPDNCHIAYDRAKWIGTIRFGKNIQWDMPKGTGLIKEYRNNQKSFLGLGDKYLIWEVEGLQQAKVKVIFRMKPNIEITIGINEIPFGCPTPGCGHHEPIRSEVCPSCGTKFTPFSGDFISWTTNYRDGSSTYGGISTCPQCKTPLALYSVTFSGEDGSTTKTCKKCGYQP